MSSTYWRQFRSRQLAIEKKYVGRVFKDITSGYKSVIAFLREHGSIATRNNIDRLITPEAIVKTLKGLYRTAAHVEGNYVLSSLIKKGFREKRRGSDASFAIGFDEIAPVVDEYFRLYQLSKSGIPITQTSKRYIIRHLLDEIDRGVDQETAISNFRELALDSGPHPENIISRARAVRIIQTESVRAMSFGGLIGAYKSGIDLDRVWVTCDDEKVRGARRPVKFPHTRLDMQITTLFGAWYNGEKIKFPGDPGASLENTAGCRCTQFFKEKEKPQPRIPRRSLANFLTDFFAGFLMTDMLTSAIISQQEIANE